MIKRIELVMQSQNLAPSQFADKIGVQRSGLSHILSGRNNPSLDFVQKVLLAFPDLNPTWFLQGRGRMYVNLSDSKAADFGQDSASVPGGNFVDRESPLASCIPGFVPMPERAEPVRENPEYADSDEPEEADTSAVGVGGLFEEKPKVRRILLFYEDGTFEEYARR